MTQSDILIVERAGDIAVLTINRPPANALNAELIALLRRKLAEFSAETPAPGLILTGSGTRFFSAGGDIKEVVGLAVALPRIRDFHGILCELERYPGPVVCAVRGFAVGGALEFLLYADHVVAGDDCRIGFPEINNGLLPAAKGMRRAAQKLGLRAAQGLLYSGELIDAARALQIGAVNEVVAPDQVMDRARAVCGDLCGKDRKLFAAIKRSLNETATMGDQELERMTIEDLGAYLDNDGASAARNRFLNK